MSEELTKEEEEQALMMDVMHSVMRVCWDNERKYRHIVVFTDHITMELK